MSLFRKKKNNRRARASGRLGVQAQAVVERWLVGLSAYLNRKTCYWNRSAKLTALILFCLLFGGGCVWLLLKAIIH